MPQLQSMQSLLTVLMRWDGCRISLKRSWDQRRPIILSPVPISRSWMVRVHLNTRNRESEGRMTMPQELFKPQPIQRIDAIAHPREHVPVSCILVTLHG